MIYQIAFYVPETHLNEVKEAMFAEGAGHIGDYTKCAWQTKGVGQFCPQENSDPYLGTIDKLESVTEYKIEMVCKEECVKATVAALKLAHPYEEPAYSVIKLENS